MTLYDFPAEHWSHLRTGNPIESVFVGVRLRTDVAKRIRRRENALYLVFRVAQRQGHAWRQRVWTGATITMEDLWIMSGEAAVKILPMLSLRDAIRAVDFYRRAFGATEQSRVTSPEGRVVALLAIQGAEFGIVDEVPAVGNLSPETLGGTSVRISLHVADPDGVAQQAVEAGAELISPVEDQPYGMRQGRVRDPFGHHWLIGRPIADQPAAD